MHIALITDIPPCDNYTAGLVLQKQVNFLLDEAGGGYSLSLILVSDPSLKPKIDPNTFSKIRNVLRIHKPREDYGQQGVAKSLIYNTFNRICTCKEIGNKITKFIEDKNIDLLWFVVQGQTMIILSELISKSSRKKYIVQVWDHPSWWLNENKFDSFSRRAVLRSFKSLLVNSNCAIAASDQMAACFVSEYKVANSIAVMPSLNKCNYEKREKSKTKFNIVFTGQLYCPTEFLSFIKALDLINWTIDGRQVCLDIYSPYFDHSLIENVSSNKIVLHNWTPQAEVLKIVSNADLCYCPYRFDGAWSLIAKYSFPAKLTTYLSTGSCVFIHAPQNSSIYTFLSQDEDGSDVPGGVLCSSIESNIIASQLLQLNKNVLSSIGRKGFQRYLKRLTDDRMKNDFLNAIN